MPASFPSAAMTPERLAALIDHTLLKPDATRADILTLCAEAEAHRFASVCVNPCWVRVAADALAASGVPVCAVIGFPLGATTTAVKVYEAGEALRDGAREIDMVINVGALRGGAFDVVREDIAAVAGVCHRAGALLKVILETGLLDDGQKETACRLAAEAGADFVKTSTGFGAGGATVADVQLMRRVVGPAIGVKASGGIRDLPTLLAMVSAGATRIGASAGVRIMAEARASAPGASVSPMPAGPAQRTEY